MAKDLVLNIIMRANDKATEAFARAKAASNSLSGALAKSQQALRAVEKAQRNLARHRELLDKLKQTDAALAENRRRQHELAAEMMRTGAVTRAQQREMSQLQAKAKTLQTAQGNLRRETRALGIELRQNGINARHYGQAEAELRRRHDATAQAVERERHALDRLNRARHTRDRAGSAASALRSASATAMIGGTVVTAGVGKTVVNAMSEQDAMLGVIRQVQGLKNADNSLNLPEIAKIRAEMQQLSRELPLTTVEIMQMYEANARMNISRAELAGKVRLDTQMATAFDAEDPGELSEAFGRIRNNFKLSAERSERLADVINWLDDNALSKGTDIIGFMRDVGGSLGMAKISEQNTAALGSTLLSQGVDQGTASRAVSSLFTRLASAPNLKPVRTALETVGLNPAKIRAGMVTDANATVIQVMDAVRAMPKELQAGILKGIAGGEFNRVFAGLVSNPGEWQRQIALANSDEAKGSMQREFDTRMQSLSAKWQIFKNRLFNTTSDSGRLLFGTLESLLDVTGRWLDRMDNWVKQHPQAAAAIMKVVAVSGLLLLAFAGLAAAVAAVIVPAAAAKLSWVSLFGQMETGTGIVARLANLFKGTLLSSISRLGSFMMANPILAAVVLIAGGLYLLYTHWETVKNALIRGWQWIDNVFRNNPILNFIFPIIGLARLLINNWDIIGPFFAQLWQGIKTTFADNPALYTIPFVGWAMYLINNWQKVGPFFAGLWQSIKSFFSGGISGITAQIVNWSPLGLFYQAFAAVLRWFGIELPAKLSTAGRNMIQSLINGIKSMLPDLSGVWRQTTNLFNGLNNSARRAPGAVGNIVGGRVAKGFSIGGYTGSGGINQIAGLVHRGEVVFSQADVRRFGGWRAVEALRTGGMRALQSLGGGNTSPAPALAGAGGVTINVYAAPGQDERSIARAVAAELDKRQSIAARRANSRYQDKD